MIFFSQNSDTSRNIKNHKTKYLDNLRDYGGIHQNNTSYCYNPAMILDLAVLAQARILKEVIEPHLLQNAMKNEVYSERTSYDAFTSMV